MPNYIIVVFSFFLLIGISSCSNDTAGENVNTSDTLLPKSISELNKRILDEPNNASLYHERAKAYFANKLYKEALADMQRAIKVDSTIAEQYVTLADIYLATNKTRGTKEALEKSIALAPDNTTAIMKLAELLFLVKSYDESLKYLNDVLKIDQFNAKAYFMKGMNFLEKGDTSSAISSMQTAVEQDQKYYAAYMQMGWLYAEKKNRLAIDYYDNALKLQPHSIEAYYGKAKFLQDIGDWENAALTYNALLEVDPHYKNAYYNLGAIELLSTKKYEKALGYFDKAINADANYVEAYYARGTCYEALGNKKKALENYSIALQLNPGYEPALTSVTALQGK